MIRTVRQPSISAKSLSWMCGSVHFSMKRTKTSACSSLSEIRSATYARSVRASSANVSSRLRSMARLTFRSIEPMRADHPPPSCGACLGLSGRRVMGRLLPFHLLQGLHVPYKDRSVCCQKAAGRVVRVQIGGGDPFTRVRRHFSRIRHTASASRRKAVWLLKLR